MSSSDEQGEKKLDDAQLAAITTSVSIIVFFIIYWAAQIQTTYDLLSMAYEW